MMALPSNAAPSLKNLTTMVDDMWYYAGDRSTYVNTLQFVKNNLQYWTISAYMISPLYIVELSEYLYLILCPLNDYCFASVH